MVTVAAYLKGIPPRNQNPEKPQLLYNIIEGVNSCGDKGIIVNDFTPINSDVGVIQGFVHPGSKNVPHLNLRQQVLNQQQEKGKRSLIADSNLFLSYDPTNSQGYLRYSYDGIFPGTGEYCNDDPDPNRWNIISKNLGIRLKPWFSRGNMILICCQRDGGWSMDGQPLMPWIIDTIKNIRRYSDRKILLRFHPGDKKAKDHKRYVNRMKWKDVIISQSPTLINDLKYAHVLISYNSSPAIIAGIEGTPIIVLDPEKSQAKDISIHDLSQIENVKNFEFDRELWVRKIAQMHWNMEELKDGTAWRHLRQWVR